MADRDEIDRSLAAYYQPPDAPTLGGPPQLPPIRLGTEPPLAQHNLIDSALGSFGRPSLEAVEGGYRGERTPQEIAWEFLANGPMGPFGAIRVPDRAIRAYHGAGQPYEGDRFNPRRSQYRAFFAADDPEAASRFARDFYDSPRVYPVDIMPSARIFDPRTNPAHGDALAAAIAARPSLTSGMLMGPQTIQRLAREGDGGLLEMQGIQQWLRQNRYDGWRFEDTAANSPNRMSHGFLRPGHVRNALTGELLY